MSKEILKIKLASHAYPNNALKKKKRTRQQGGLGGLPLGKCYETEKFDLLCGHVAAVAVVGLHSFDWGDARGSSLGRGGAFGASRPPWLYNFLFLLYLVALNNSRICCSEHVLRAIIWHTGIIESEAEWGQILDIVGEL